MLKTATKLISETGCTDTNDVENVSVSVEGDVISSDSQFLDIDINNARQLGGYIGADGRKIKDNVLIRMAGISGISDETAEKLAKEYNVKYVVDFRMNYEREHSADKDISGAENIWISVYELDMSDPKIIDMMKRIKNVGDDSLQKAIEYAKTGYLSSLYTQILFGEAGQKGYARFFDILLKNRDGAVLWHCTYGKDRTGIAAALVLYALGVDEDVIMQDFLMTNEVYKDAVAYLEKELKNRGCDDMLIKEAQAMAGVKGEYLRAAFDAVKSEYGSIQDYIKNQLGVSDEKIAKLRDMYLV